MKKKPDLKKILVTVRLASGRIVNWNFKRGPEGYEKSTKAYVYSLQLNRLHLLNAGLERWHRRDHWFEFVHNIQVLAISHPRFYLDVLCPE